MSLALCQNADDNNNNSNQGQINEQPAGDNNGSGNNGDMTIYRLLSKIL